MLRQKARQELQTMIEELITEMYAEIDNEIAIEVQKLKTTGDANFSGLRMSLKALKLEKLKTIKRIVENKY